MFFVFKRFNLVGTANYIYVKDTVLGVLFCIFCLLSSSVVGVAYKVRRLCILVTQVAFVLCKDFNLLNIYYYL